jgi:E3 ubiquitin-protein ligase SIAH1
MSGEPSPTPIETGNQSSAKKARVESSPRPRHQVKLEAAGEEAASGGRALLVLGGDAAAAARIEIDRDMLHCPLCTLPLKPPIFQVCSLFYPANQWSLFMHSSEKKTSFFF